MKQVLSAGAVPVRLKQGKWEFLILRAYKYWDFPKGVVEPDEDPWDGAIREIAEETGLTKLSAPWGKIYAETEPYGKGKTARHYLVKVEEDKEIVLLPNPITGVIEHHEHRWLTYEEAKSLLVPRTKAILDWANRAIID